MKSIIFSIIVIALTLLSVNTQAQAVDNWDGTATKWTKGSGTIGYPYLIENAEILAYLAEKVNAGETYKSTFFKLTVNIDLQGAESNSPRLTWIPIGNSKDNALKAIFDGDNHTISNMYVNEEGDYAGLFGSVSTGILKNLKVKGVVIGQGQYIGGLVGYAGMPNMGIENCVNECTVTGVNNVGGLVGYSELGITFLNCYNAGSITGHGDNIGGIIGMSNSSLRVLRCHNTGLISGANNVGGVAGYQDQLGSVTNSYNRGNITGTGSQIGGIVGISSKSSVNDCYNTATITATGGSVGGLVGNSTKDNIINSYNVGSVKGVEHIGSIVGTASSINVSNSYYLAVEDIENNYGTSKSEAEIKSDELIKVINRGTKIWVKDTKNVNNGYPVLRREIVTDLAWINNASKEFAGGTGAKEDPYLISSAADLAFLSRLVYVGNIFKGAHFRVTKDIDMKGSAVDDKLMMWTPIGLSENTYFSGIFDGGNHTISNIYCENELQMKVGLFGWMKDGTIKNVITGNDCIMYNRTTPSTAGIAAVVVELEGQAIVDNCRNQATIISDPNDMSYSAGIVSWSKGLVLIQNCSNTGKIVGVGPCIGGIIAILEGTLINCYNSGEIWGKSKGTGGIAGRVSNGAKISNCYNRANVTGGKDETGSIVGAISPFASMSNCYRLEGTAPDNGFGIVKSMSEMKSNEFIELLNKNNKNIEVWCKDEANINEGFPIVIVKLNIKIETTKGGSATGAGFYIYGSDVELKAIAEEHYKFVRWNDGVTTPTRIVKLIEDMTYRAIFELEEHTITVESNEGGTVRGGGKFVYGAETMLMASANEGYHFKQWSDGSQEAKRLVPVIGDATYIAVFASGVGVEDANMERQIDIWSYNNQIVIESMQTCNVKVYDINGRMIKETAIDTGKTSIEMSNSGLYIVKCYTNSEIITNKIVIND